MDRGFAGDHPRHEARDRTATPGANREIEAGNTLEDTLAESLGHAAHESHDARRTFTLGGAKEPEFAERLVFGLAAYAARVDHDEVGLILVACGHVSCGLKQGGGGFGIADVHLATVGV